MLKITKLASKCRVYDITVEGNHNFYANGILVSNCQEVTHPSTPMKHLNDPEGLLGICILCAINPVNIKTDDDLEKVCNLSVRMLDHLIDYQDYFCLPAENFATKYRSLGIGVTNFAAWLAKKGLKYSSEEARSISNEFFEKFQFFLLKASNKLAQEKGKCEWFEKTKYSDGTFPIDTYEKSIDSFITSELKMDWNWLREEVRKHGLRNSTLTCYMPCEASSLSTNSTNGIERPRSKFLIKSNKSKEIPVVTPNHKRWTYEYAFENADNEDHLKMMAVIQKYCDMAISTNLYYNYRHYPEGKIPAKVINKDLINAYRYGLKTIYYTNSDDGNVHNLNETQGCESGACAV